MVIVTLASTVLMLSCTSPEFSWDEAFRLPYTADSWSSLWSGYRVSHGPMAVYLAKLGQEVLPASAASLELRSRFLSALVGSVAIGFLYWTLRHSFKTSRAAAFVGSSLLLFSVIRLEETNIIGPHHLMLACTLAIAGLGYHWRDRPTPQTALGLGAVMAFGALSTTYIIPAVVCWAISVSVASREWITWDRKHFKISWSFPILLATTVTLVVALWPPGVVRLAFVRDFLFYLHLSGHPTLLGDRIVEVTPRSAAVYWLVNLDAPILVVSISIIAIALYNASRNRQLSSKHAYLSVFLVFFLATALLAHMAGARNLLQLIGVLGLATGALFDEALGYKPRLIRFGSAMVAIAAALNLIWLVRVSDYIPFLATDGYTAFLKENGSRLHEKNKAFVYGLPILTLYAQQYGTSIGWELSYIPWTTRTDAPLPENVKYVLIPEFVYKYMPQEQPMRRVVADHWKVAWSFKADRVWELRLYEKP
jgi:Dolichyl-phosphate-mannose-protein mannosyltransferase